MNPVQQLQLDVFLAKVFVLTAYAAIVAFIVGVIAFVGFGCSLLAQVRRYVQLYDYRARLEGFQAEREDVLR